MVLQEGSRDVITRLRLGREIVLGVLLSVNLQFTRIAVDFLFLLKLLKKQKIQTDKYRKSSIKPPPGGGGGLFFFKQF